MKNLTVYPAVARLVTNEAAKEDHLRLSAKRGETVWARTEAYTAALLLETYTGQDIEPRDVLAVLTEVAKTREIDLSIDKGHRTILASEVTAVQAILQAWENAKH